MTQFLLGEGERGRLLGPGPVAAALAAPPRPFCLPPCLVVGRRPVLAEEMVCVMCTRGPGASEVQILWQEVSPCLVLPTEQGSVRH